MLILLLTIVGVFIVYKLVECWAAARAISAIVHNKLHIQQREIKNRTKFEKALRDKELKNGKI